MVSLIRKFADLLPYHSKDWKLELQRKVGVDFGFNLLHFLSNLSRKSNFSPNFYVFSLELFSCLKEEILIAGKKIFVQGCLGSSELKVKPLRTYVLYWMLRLWVTLPVTTEGASVTFSRYPMVLAFDWV